MPSAETGPETALNEATAETVVPGEGASLFLVGLFYEQLTSGERGKPS